MTVPILMSFDTLVTAVRRAVLDFYGPSLAALAVFGSVARRTPRPDSDVDLLVVADGLPDGRMRRRAAFRSVEDTLADSMERLARAGVETRFSPEFRTPAELAYGGAVFLDMVHEVRILFDRSGLLAGHLSGLRANLRQAGARRVPYKDAWVWDLGTRVRETGPPSAGTLLARAYVLKASRRLLALETLLDVESYSDVVREAQETVELALKGLLRNHGVDPRKAHDIGDVVLKFRGRLSPEVSAVADRLAAISRELGNERERAFYGDLDFIPTEEYSREDAVRALANARFVVEVALREVPLGAGPAGRS